MGWFVVVLTGLAVMFLADMADWRRRGWVTACLKEGEASLPGILEYARARGTDLSVNALSVTLDHMTRERLVVLRHPQWAPRGALYRQRARRAGASYELTPAGHARPGFVPPQTPCTNDAVDTQETP